MATATTESFSKPRASAGQASGSINRRPATHARLTTMMRMGSDVVAVLVALLLALNLGLERFLGPGMDMQKLLHSGTSISAQLGYLAWFTIALLAVGRHQGLYQHSLTYSMLHELRRVFLSGLIAGLLLCGAMFSMHNIEISRAVVMFLIGLTTIFCGISSMFWRYLIFRRYERGVDMRNVLILGSGGIAVALYKQITGNRHLGREFKGFIDVPSCGLSAAHQQAAWETALEQLRGQARQHFIDEIIITETCSTNEVLGLVELARELSIEILVIPGFYDGIIAEAPIDYLGDFPIVAIHHRDEQAVARLAKRTTDIVLSLLALAVAAPIMLAIAIAIRFDSAGPAFYSSERIGHKGRVFRCFKFRTMVQNAEQLKAQLMALNERTGILFKMTNDPRVTRVGRILRKYSLDEIPQFLNVLRGEMSLVGPRPPVASEVEKYAVEHFRRLEVLPGLTGLWQIRARQDPSFERYVALDLAYVENWSLWLDFKIMLRTADAVFRGTGA
jgi:exopolysaccharide biosynthesis polyprenyl glycosylphosphotransferase